MNWNRCSNKYLDTNAHCSTVDCSQKVGQNQMLINRQRKSKLGYIHTMGFLGDSEVKSPPAGAGDSRRCKFHTWFGKIPGRRAWQPTPIFLSGKSYGHVNVWQKPLQYCQVISLQLIKINEKKKKSHGQRSLAGYSPWSGKELDWTVHTAPLYNGMLVNHITWILYRYILHAWALKAYV